MNKRSFLWSRIFLVGLVASCAVLTVAGIAATYVDLPAKWDGSLDAVCAVAFAGIAGFALGVSQMAAAMAVTLQGRREGVFCPFNLAVACSLVCGLISLGGIHLGAERLGLDPFWLDLAGGALCVVKPTMSYLTEAAREVSTLAVQSRADAAEAAFYADRSESRALEAKRLETAAPAALPAPATSSAPPPVRRQRTRNRRKGRNLIAKAATTIAIATGMGAAALPAHGETAAPAPVTSTERIARPAPTLDDVERAREEMIRRGAKVTQETLAAHLGCSRKAVRKAIGDPHA